MWLIEDTRQQAGKHKIKHQWWTTHGDEVIRCKLPFGDYALPPEVSVDTKQDLTEIASNMCGTYNEKRRFREECKFAQTCGCELYFLIETDQVKEVDDLFGKRVRLAVFGQRYYKFVFCIVLFDMHRRLRVKHGHFKR